MRRHPERLSDDQKHRLNLYLNEQSAVQAIYVFKQQLTALLRENPAKPGNAGNSSPNG